MNLVIEDVRYLLEGTYYTMLITIVSMVFGLLIGFFICMLRLSEKKLLVILAKFYVSVIRGTPLLVQIFIIYYGLPDFGITLKPLTAAFISLSINIGAFLSETIRGAIISIPKGQMEAAVSVGMTYWQAMKRIILPQALRVAIPPMGNTFIGMLKETSLVSVITVTELLRASQLLISKYLVVMPFYLAIALIYWIMSTLFSIILATIEKRLSVMY
ncbi:MULTISPECIES: amino acid ABC transporter permease [Clostridium]|uniref:L-cystine ABC transporter, permease n=2 Tax=Clostridium TaxID=1485 RepID=A0A0E3JWP2_CLOSL|nr:MULTISPECIES: amino acid ABC transporter permease [Clostridium]AKA67374.1 L-cystine ABC transporter, permease [Clostridium scatologenes]AWI06179.1 ABC transporter permease [Clostridium drakei]